VSLSTERALWRQGENAERSASLPWYYNTGDGACQVFLKKILAKTKNVGATPKGGRINASKERTATPYVTKNARPKKRLPVLVS